MATSFYIAWRVRARIVLVSVVALLAALAPAAGASRDPTQPLVVTASSFTQDAQELIWRVDLAQPFWATWLVHDRRTLCLLIERVNNGSAAGQLCVAPPRRGGRSPRVVYMHITAHGAGPGHAVNAKVTRSSDRELTATFLPAALGLTYRPVRWQVISTLARRACLPVKPGQARCVKLFPRRPTLAKFHVPQLVGCTANGPAFVFNGPASPRQIALTFDDGPWPDTPQVLDVLEREHVVATFFEIGNQVGEYGEGGAIERRMLADGDMIGDHTWDHQDVSGAGPFAAGEISQAAAAIRQATGGFEPCLFRAPYGAVSSGLISEARSMGFTTIQWNIDPRDWARPGTAAIYQNVISNARPGAIVEEHDGGGDRSETIAALPVEINTLRSEGYQFVTVTQMLGERLFYR
jgi:peptidoglycan/xylan/chitin deacetylase (PgdA/CDA1 family)